MSSRQHSSRRIFIRSLMSSGAASVYFSKRGSGQDQSDATKALPTKSTIDDDLAQALGKAELSMRYRGSTVEEGQAWQRLFRSKLNELLGDSTPPARWTVLEEERVSFKDHVRHSLLLIADGLPALPVHLLVPNQPNGPDRKPAVVCLHGHGPHGYDPIVGRVEIDGVAEAVKKHNYDYGLQFVRRGYVVAAPCLIPFGRRVRNEKYGKDDPCAITFIRMQSLGKLPIASNLRDIRWTIDFLSRHEQVIADRIGCAGLSYGGRMTMMASAIDERIRVAAVSGALNQLQERMSLRHSCGSQMIPGLLKYGDYSEIGSLIAPKPCVWETGSEDRLMVRPWDEQFREQLRKIYRSLGAADKLQFDRFEGGHVWSGRIAFPLFDEVLKS